MAHSTSTNVGDNELPRLISHLNESLTTIGSAIVEKLFPPATANLQRLRQAITNAPLYGDTWNCSFFTPQINISPINADLKNSLGQAGDIHTDDSDEPFGLSVFICLSKLSDQTYPGRFFHAETREWFDTPPLTVFLLRGSSPHGGTSPRSLLGGAGKPWERRIHIVLYPNSQFMNRAKPIVYPRAATVGAGYRFFKDGRACLGGQSSHRSWCSRELVLHLIQDLKEQVGIDPCTVDIHKIYEAIPDILSFSDDVHPWSQKAESIRQRVTEANNLLKSIRLVLYPTDVAQGNGPSKRKSGASQKAQNMIPRREG